MLYIWTLDFGTLLGGANGATSRKNPIIDNSKGRTSKNYVIYTWITKGLKRLLKKKKHLLSGVSYMKIKWWQMAVTT